MFLEMGEKPPTTAFTATVEPFTDIHLWLLPIAKNVIGLTVQCIRFGAWDLLDFPFSFLFLFLSFGPLVSDPHCERPLGAASSLSGFQVFRTRASQAF